MESKKVICGSNWDFNVGGGCKNISGGGDGGNIIGSGHGVWKSKL